MEYRMEHDSMGEVRVPADAGPACLQYQKLFYSVFPSS